MGLGGNSDDRKQRLISSLKEEGWLRTPRVIRAFENVNRKDFVPARFRDAAYIDKPLPIGKGQTISAPSMVAVMTELLEPKSTDRVLEIGTGSGYQAAILSMLVKNVCTIELEPTLAKSAEENLRKAGCKNVRVIVGDGSRGYNSRESNETPLAWGKHASRIGVFDKIIITCAAPEIPEALKKQLKTGGILVAPVDGMFSQVLTVLKKKEKDRFERKRYMRCVFVPLRH